MKTEINYGGYTSNGSDYSSTDGELAAVMGLENEEGQLRCVEAPKCLVKFDLADNSPYEVKYIHRTSLYEHLIVVHEKNTPRHCFELYWIKRGDIEDELTITAQNKDDYLHYLCDIADYNDGHAFHLNPVNDINAIGNTLVVLSDYGMHYCLWSDGGYKYLGDHLPELPLSFGLRATSTTSDQFTFVSVIEQPNNPGDTVDLFYGQIDNITQTVLAQVNKFIAEKATNAGKFIFPFFVRYAYRLYDGQLTMHSSPVLMVTQSSVTPIVTTANTDLTDKYYGKVTALVSQLDYICLDAEAKRLLSKWSDIVQSVDVFISAPIYTYNQSGKVEQWSRKMSTEFGYTVSKATPSPGYAQGYAQQSVFPTVEPDISISHLVLPRYSEDHVKEQIRSCSLFYLLKSINLQDIAVPDEVSPSDDDREIISIPDDYLPSLTSREVMTDDYDSHDKLMPKSSYIYNSRLTIASLKKQLSAPLHPNVYKPYEDGFRRVRVYFFIKQDQKEYVVSTPEVEIGAGEGAAFKAFRYLYYPNGNAYKALVVQSRNTPGPAVSHVEIPLRRHDFLNGAYFFDGWDPVGTAATIPALSTDLIVYISNKIYTSEVNNPYLFPLSGIVTVGSGDIIGMAAAVKVISQNEFGREPMYVFTTDGVWPMQVNRDGTLSPAKPVTLDVCTDPGSITHLSNTILFATERGIMMLGGTEVLCITDVLLGEESFGIDELPRIEGLLDAGMQVTIHPFKEFLNGCRLLYDYKRYRVIVFNPEYPYAYLYSLKSKLWSMMPSDLRSVVHSYPEAMAMNSSQELVVFEDNPEHVYSGLVVTRPLKLGDGNAYKSIRTMVQRGKFIKGHVKTLLYASRDLCNWHLIASSNSHWIRGLRGTGYKWFRVVLLTSMGKGESVSGSTVEFDVKQAGKMH